MPTSLLKWKEPDTVKIGGRKYKTVVIGNQRWLAENLDYKIPNCNFNPSTWNSTNRNYCYYNNSPSSYRTGWGLLYNWYAVSYLNDNRSTLLPAGWHVPSLAEFNTLFSAVGGNSNAGKVLKSKTGWYSDGNGTDNYGFTALPASGRYADGVQWVLSDAYALFWTITKRDGYNPPLAYRVDLSWSSNSSGDSSYDYRWGMSLRLVKTVV